MTTNRQYIYCMHCGYKNLSSANFCQKCGHPLHVSVHKNESFVGETTRTINSWTGENTEVKINLRNFFSQIFKVHTRDQAESIFIAGTKSTTPSLLQISSKPVQPWLYTRILIGFLLTVTLLGFLEVAFGNELELAFVFILSFTTPATLMVFFFEVNVFKNISFYTTIEIAILGGIFSLIVTMGIYLVVGNGNFSLLGSILIGTIEETGKLLVGAFFVNKMKATHIFNGLLIGGAVGAGFTAFENIIYATNLNSQLIIPIVRSLASFGTHSIWCAISVAALVLAKGNKPLTWNNIANHRFFNFFILVIVLHALWDWSLPFATVKTVVLIVAAWITLFVLIHAGLREVKVLQNITRNNNKLIGS